MQRNLRQVLVVVAWLVTIGINMLAVLLPLNGLETGEISDLYPTLVAPAGYVFSIWGVIYLWVLGYAVYQALPRQRQQPVLRQVAPWFGLSCAANSLWIFAWHYRQLPWSLVLMTVLLLALIRIYLLLDIGRIAVPSAEKWWVHRPFSLYLGWITVASIANVAALLVDGQWGGWGLAPDLWTALILLTAGAIGVIVSLRRADVVYVLVLVWALVGIIIQHQAYAPVVGAAVIAIVLLLLSLGVSLRRQRANLRPDQT